MVIAAELETRIWDTLRTVEDPELPIPVTDLGMIEGVDIADGRVRIAIVPTYSACPAVDVIRRTIADRIGKLPGVVDVRVDVTFARPWTMARMTERGKQRLVAHGMAVTGSRGAGKPGHQGLGAGIPCPFCGSTNTVLENPFGPTLCRAIYYCNDCKNPIERFKPPLDD